MATASNLALDHPLEHYLSWLIRLVFRDGFANTLSCFETRPRCLSLRFQIKYPSTTLVRSNTAHHLVSTRLSVGYHATQMRP